jgi:hypothetical protein
VSLSSEKIVIVNQILTFKHDFKAQREVKWAIAAIIIIVVDWSAGCRAA